jgi:hypothetical protein
VPKKAKVNMNVFKTEHTRGADVSHVRAFENNPRGFLNGNFEDAQIERVKAPEKPFVPKPHPKSVARPAESARPGVLPPYILEVEVNCEECGGSGFDRGGIDPWGPELCSKCHGGKTQRITRNYLAEAFQIAANPDSMRQVERQHLGL